MQLDLESTRWCGGQAISSQIFKASEGTLKIYESETWKVGIHKIVINMAL